MSALSPGKIRMQPLVLVIGNSTPRSVKGLDTADSNMHSKVQVWSSAPPAVRDPCMGAATLHSVPNTHTIRWEN